MTLLYEACVTSVSQARLAERAGARRLELCARLGVGGMTPPVARIAAVRAATTLPLHVMIRRDAGNFRCDAAQRRRMHADAQMARAAGADGIVVGILAGDSRVDLPAMRTLLQEAGGMAVTFHRAFDRIPDPLEALEELVGLGVHRILTSGGAPTARQGAPGLARLVAAARGRIGIIAAGTVRADHAAALAAATGVHELHAHLRTAGEMRALARALG